MAMTPPSIAWGTKARWSSENTSQRQKIRNTYAQIKDKLELTGKIELQIFVGPLVPFGKGIPAPQSSRLSNKTDFKDNKGDISIITPLCTRFGVTKAETKHSSFKIGIHQVNLSIIDRLSI